MSLSPAGGDCRIWLIDECAKLSNDAQNAFLKMLEDTPKHVYFFLATTDPQKLLKTIRTRCMEMALKDLTDKQLHVLLDKVLKKEDKEIPEEVADQIVLDSLGSARMALVLLDKIIDLPKKSMLKAVESQSANLNEAIELCRALMNGDKWNKIAKILKGLQDDPEKVRHNVMGYARQVMLNGKPDKAFVVIDSFKDNFYDSKAAGLAGACYEVLNG